MTERSTDALIALLSSDVKRVSPRAGQIRLAIGVAIGSAAALIIVDRLGWRPDLVIAMLAMNFWVKMIYTATICALGLYWLRDLARPDSDRPRWHWILLPILALAVVAAWQMMQAPKGAMPHMLMGDSWRVCARNILIVSVPVYVALLWVMRRFAPTQLTAAGAATGLVAGAAGASVYCLHCPETSMLFVLVWYSLGIILATLIGALLGPRLLNW